mmetsp:Transcript_18286/g.42979  ORF Transcript_18286/g.42979 Transcript_18286/m.42979 type:complete len:263 (+) Transcript_18286:132-920(+)|eukprot:CAMPEP_0114557708 /NCGR_PEP_ID=MMETSP0114-20121206/9978_1 /TAXON_ID=31324 /ORGANISM="Goniomonas sp, Strain m" /LENGTH=262 /DNA_ID=CAMNT_0001743021 /DNA_START=132 /DNA_END=920 /DNA_ORIENTATION=+
MSAGGVPDESDRIVLNVGGNRFETTTATLRAHSPTFFSALVSENFRSSLDSQGVYFIDRDGEAFKPLLQFMRNGNLIIPPTVSTAEVMAEAQFYGLQAAVDLLSAPILAQPKLRTAEDGFYLCTTCETMDDKTEAVCFLESGHSVHTRGENCCENIAAVRVIGLEPEASVPELWTVPDTGAAIQSLRYFMNRVQRGTFQLQGDALLLQRPRSGGVEMCQVVGVVGADTVLLLQGGSFQPWKFRPWAWATQAPQPVAVSDPHL